jgi:glycosyltransferase involved in cell wall biosynthesis
MTLVLVPPSHAAPPAGPDAERSAATGSPIVPVGIIVLTFNSGHVIERTLRAALQVSPSIIVVDSGSTDATVALATSLGAQVVRREFRNYADQRNWAIEQFGHRMHWQLHLDADEVLDDLAIAEIHRALRDPGESTGFILKRRTYFLGRPLRFGGASNFHLRLFRSGSARCEDRLYDQHFVAARPAVLLRGLLHDLNVGSLSEWTARHNRWSDLEAVELCRGEDGARRQITARLSRDPRERRRLYKRRYYQLPPLLRAFLLFGYRYVVQGGFLDGRAGFLYAFFQVLWFRTLVDAKLLESRG